jgi:hypothetical protein
VQDQTMVIRAFRHLLRRYSGPSQKLFALINKRGRRLAYSSRCGQNMEPRDPKSLPVCTRADELKKRPPRARTIRGDPGQPTLGSQGGLLGAGGH